MIDLNNNYRIIGDFLEINADIVRREVNSKLPKFLTKFRSKIYRKKLLKIAEKLRISNYNLTTENLVELFSYTYNNFPPEGKYKSVFSSIVDENIKCIEALIIFDSCKALITIDKNSTGFDISISDKKSEDYTESCAIHCDALFHDGPRSEIIKRINKELLNVITDYIIESISAYK